MDRLRRAGKAVIIVLGVTWSLVGVLPHQTRALSPALTNSQDVRLVAQNFNILAGTQFRFTVGVPDAVIRNQLEHCVFPGNHPRTSAIDYNRYRTGWTNRSC
jgi:hypothetical protein